jgi:fructose-1,6-bisphosphatase II
MFNIKRAITKCDPGFTYQNDSNLTLAFSHVTEIGAIAAAHTAGFGDKEKADFETVKAMRDLFNRIDFKGRVVIGEGERDKAPMLYIGEKLGTGKGPQVDIAIDPLENTNGAAFFGPRSVSVLAASEKGGLFHAPDMYLEKLIVGAQSAGKVSLNFPVSKNLEIIAQSLDRSVSDLVIVVLDRDRNQRLISEIRKAGARVKLIPDGDLIPGVAVCMGGSGIHGVMGIGAAPEGVITSAGIRCLKGEMQARFWIRDEAEKKRLIKMGGQPDKIYSHNDLASGKTIIFCATAVTDGELFKGVRFFGGGARTNSLVMSTKSSKIRFIETTHTYDREKLEYRLS